MSTPLSDAPSPRRLQRVPSRKGNPDAPRLFCKYCGMGIMAAYATMTFPEHPERPAENLCRRHAREALVTHDPIAQARDRLRLACQAERAAKDETDAAGHALDELLRAERPVPQVCRFPVPEPEEPPRGKRV